MKHTPGPWTCISAEFGKVEEGTIKFEVKMNEQIICKADANLIAAAPDMYDALNAIANMQVQETTNHQELSALCISIARITLEKIKIERGKQ